MKNEVKIRIFGGLFQNAGQNKVVKILIFASFFVIFKSKLAKTCKNEKSRFRQEFGVCSTQTPVIIYNRQATPSNTPRPKFLEGLIVKLTRMTMIPNVRTMTSILAVLLIPEEGKAWSTSPRAEL